MTLYLTRTLFALRGTRTVLDVAPAIVGAVTSNSRPGTFSVPIHVSTPTAPPVAVKLAARWIRPLPCRVCMLERARGIVKLVA